MPKNSVQFIEKSKFGRFFTFSRCHYNSLQSNYQSKFRYLFRCCEFSCSFLIFHIEPSLSESEERHCISIICLLAGDSCNRAKIRMSGAFKRIIEVAKNTNCDDTLAMVC